MLVILRFCGAVDKAGPQQQGIARLFPASPLQGCGGEAKPSSKPALERKQVRARHIGVKRQRSILACSSEACLHGTRQLPGLRHIDLHHRRQPQALDPDTGEKPGCLRPRQTGGNRVRPCQISTGTLGLVEIGAARARLVPGEQQQAIGSLLPHGSRSAAGGRQPVEVMLGHVGHPGALREGTGNVFQSRHQVSRR